MRKLEFGYIDAWGRGTLKILDACKAAELPEPEMVERDGGFLITLFKERLTEDFLQKLGLNERQAKALTYLKEKGKISNTEFQNLNKVSKATATRDLVELEKIGLLINKGTKGSSAIYVLDNTYSGEPIGGDFT